MKTVNLPASSMLENSLDLESGVILAYDQQEQNEINVMMVSVLPVWKWLLAENTPVFQ